MRLAAPYALLLLPLLLVASQRRQPQLALLPRSPLLILGGDLPLLRALVLALAILALAKSDCGHASSANRELAPAANWGPVTVNR